MVCGTCGAAWLLGARAHTALKRGAGLRLHLLADERIASRHQWDTVPFNGTVTYMWHMVAVAVVSLAVMCSYGPDRLLGAFE